MVLRMRKAGELTFQVLADLLRHSMGLQSEMIGAARRDPPTILCINILGIGSYSRRRGRRIGPSLKHLVRMAASDGRDVDVVPNCAN